MSTPLRREVSQTPPDRWLIAAASALLAFGALALMVIGHGAGPVDQWLFNRVGDRRGGPAFIVAEVLTALGSLPVVVTVALAAAAALWSRTHHLRSAGILLGAVAATTMVVYLVEIAVQRTRPTTDGSAAVYPTASAADSSFPAGPITDVTVVYGLAAVLLAAGLRRPARRVAVLIGTALVALLIGLARIYLGYHWATDVIAGWLLATAVIAGAYALERRLRPPGLVRVTRTPEAAAGAGQSPR